ncbi:cyclin-like protein [Halteromyces radiatus]|uniref:cyclin-like protein n=1 Tax=Halteromyces radiatus TaxID=101107 RepID=UPI00221E70FF|nr:cyclin-like protein [Halteromyces radiatus]KAI8096157.1 cyclin-like protein [Halteromyces radiatus]
MLLAPTCIKTIPPGFIDFTSSCFDAILYPNLPKHLPVQTVLQHGIPSTVQQRITHLPDLLPFIQLITEKCNVQPVHLIMALMYVQRFRNSLPSGYKAEPEAAHRIFVASLLVASKYSEDHCLSTKQVVRATGDVWSIKEITRMELALLRFLQWNLFIHPEEMVEFLEKLGFDSQWIFDDAPSSPIV